MSSSSFTCTIKFRENQTSHYNQIEPNPSHQMITLFTQPWWNFKKIRLRFSFIKMLLDISGFCRELWKKISLTRNWVKSLTIKRVPAGYCLSRFSTPAVKYCISRYVRFLSISIWLHSDILVRCKITCAQPIGPIPVTYGSISDSRTGLRPILRPMI